MKFTKIALIATVATAQNDYDYPVVGLKSSSSAGVDRINRVVGRYEDWIERYGQEYKKTPKLERSVERMRKYFTWWVKGNKKGCKPAGVDRMELEFLDEDIDRTLPDNAMMKIITYQTQIKRVQALFFNGCNRQINGKLSTVVAKVTRDLTTAFQMVNRS